MEGRSRRQPTQSKGRLGAQDALSKLKAAREGGDKRALTYESKKEEELYDVLGDEEYAQLVAKRRDEGGDFIVDDDGQGYADLGEEDDHWNGRGDRDVDEEDEEEQPGKKRKGGPQPKGAQKSKKKATDADASAGSGNIGKMLSKQAARAAIAPPSRPTKANTMDSDAMLNDILCELGGAAGASARPSAAQVLPSAVPRPYPPARAAAPLDPRASAHKPSAPSPAYCPPPASTSLHLSANTPPHPTTFNNNGLGQKSGNPGSALGVSGNGHAADHQGFDCDAEDGGMHFDDGGIRGPEDEQHNDQDQGPIGQMEAEPQANGASPTQAATLPHISNNTPPSASVAGAKSHKPVHVEVQPEEAAHPAQGWAEMYSEADGGQPDMQKDEEPEAPAAAAGGSSDAGSSLEGLTVDKEGNMPFFFMDAYENTETRPGEVYLFGKVPITQQQNGNKVSFASAAAVVRGCYRSLLAVPAPEVFADADGTLAALEARAKADPSCKLELLKVLQERCNAMKAELREVLQKHNVRSFRMVPVKRSYAFEQPEIPHGEQWVIKVCYPASESALPVGLSGQTFTAITGGGQQVGSLESLILKREIKGPGWMLLKGAKRVEYQNQVSWCKVEVCVDSPKSVLSDPNHPFLKSRLSPMLTTASLNLKTIVNPKTQQHEIVAASVVYLSDCVDMEAPMPSEKWSKPQVLRNFSVVRKLDGHAWPPGFEQAVAEKNATPRGKAHNGAMWMAQGSERSLLTSLLAKLQQLDSDVLVGHNISGFDLGVLLNRMQFHKVPLWSRIGRLKRNTFPKLTGGGHAYGGGAGPGTLSTVAGRLLCDTYLSARELVKEVDYTLRTLAQTLLGQTQMEMPPNQIPLCYGSAEGLDRLMRHAESDAWLALSLMHHLAVLPLSKALSNLSGSLWSRTLHGARAQRIEMLLLHEFHARKFILPDKLSYKDKEKQSNKKEADAAAATAGALDEPDMMECDDEAEVLPSKPKGGKKAAAAAAKEKGPQYAGGLVLEPKKGLYDKIVILLDFNSLYPSIIQEYNICFTTVQRPADGSLPPLPESPAPGTPQAPLPHILASLVQQRRQAKQAMANASNPQAKQQLNIRQQALKLTANSMYGCLGFTHSRFFARPLAELITAQGRNILQSTVDIVQGTIGAEVIYGDTDSIMIYTGSDDLQAAHELAGRIKREVNRRYRLLEIELDGIFKCMLLLKKKKYASIKLEKGPEGRLLEVPEQKGLDIVRRDWCPLSKDIGNMALSAILSGRPREEVVEEIHDNLGNVRQRLSEGSILLEKFIITKQLTKRPEEYPDARAQPHVQVALRRRAAGKRDGVQPGETVPYVICVQRPSASQGDGEAPASAGTQTPGETGPSSGRDGPASGTSPSATTPSAPMPVVKSGGSGQLAERAYHPDEVRASGGQLVVDVEYYLANQVHPVVSRLCAPIEGTDPMRIAECLGLDSSRFKGAAAGGPGGGFGGDEGIHGGSIMDDDEHYKDCAPLTLLSPNGSRFEFKGAMELALGNMSVEQLFAPPDAVGDEEATISREALVNQVLLRAREAIAAYYDGELEADDELARAANNGSMLRDVVLKPSGEVGRFPHPDVTRHAGVLLSRKISERQLFLQLSHFYRLLHPESTIKRALARMRAEDPTCTINDAEVRKRLKPAEDCLRAASNAVGALRAQNSYNWVSLTKLFGVLDKGNKKAAA